MCVLQSSTPSCRGTGLTSQKLSFSQCPTSYTRPMLHFQTRKVLSCKLVSKRKAFRLNKLETRLNWRKCSIGIHAMQDDGGDIFTSNYVDGETSSDSEEEVERDVVIGPEGGVEIQLTKYENHSETTMKGRLSLIYYKPNTNQARKSLVPLPAPIGLLCLGKWYLPLTVFCFVAMANGINLTDGLDGLAGGTAALAFIGMSIAVLPIYPGLAVFGTSMAGGCIGFLMHNRYKASIFMGDTGSLALGGALAAMATCSGMFVPLFIASGVFVAETLSVMMQVFYFKITKRIHGVGSRLFRMAPLHHHFELSGVKEPYIIGIAYGISFFLSLLAAYVGLISA